ncbi:MAG: hypothetical protein H0U76_17440 [Ktedonobacteraceae bacterium]|nr:hypothetical protein [Ktedonobacteraceae bacterium]
MAHTACSFTFLTQVATDHGQQAIGTLHVGTKVLAYNPKTHTMEQEPVLHVWVHSDNDLIDLTITTTTIKGQHGTPTPTTSEVVHTNQKHPFLTIEKGFLPVGQIAVGMHVRRADGKIGVITGWKVVPGAKTMYNLEVAQDHTFTVGDGQWVVHNCGFGTSKTTFDMNHIIENHSDGTYQSLVKRAAGGNQNAAATLRKDTFFVGQTDDQIGKIVRDAWSNRVKASSRQIDPLGQVRQKWRGVGRGWQVEGWYNLTEDLVETAYPIFP